MSVERIKRAAVTIALALCVPLSSCDDGVSRYTNEYECTFVFYTYLHSTSILTRVLDNPGLYVRVEITKSLGIYHILVYPNDGSDEEDIALTTALENELDYDNVGANQSIIIGCSTSLENLAYDAQCPYCLETYTGTSYPLSFSGNGQSVTCANCDRSYTLSYGASDDGYRLLEYKVSVGSTTLVVRNG